MEQAQNPHRKRIAEGIRVYRETFRRRSGEQHVTVRNDRIREEIARHYEYPVDPNA